MSDFFKIYFDAFLITIPLTIYLIVLIIRGIKELLDFFINGDSVKVLIRQIDNISFDKLEKDIETYRSKLTTNNQWMNNRLSATIKKNELEAKLRDHYFNKREREKISLEIDHLEKTIRRINEDYWISAFNGQKTKSFKSKEDALRRIFKPE